jgi:tRNA 2-thiouridine synthesizing protein E
MIALGSDGFLACPEAWDEATSLILAETVGIALTPAHWEIIHFIRTYYQKFAHLPNNRLFVRAVTQALGPEKGDSLRLNQLFNGKPVRNACLIAGLPRPPGCL